MSYGAVRHPLPHNTRMKQAERDRTGYRSSASTATATAASIATTTAEITTTCTHRRRGTYSLRWDRLSSLLVSIIIYAKNYNSLYKTRTPRCRRKLALWWARHRCLDSQTLIRW